MQLPKRTLADGHSATNAGPVIWTGANIWTSAVTAVSACLRAHRSGTVRVKPTWRTGASVWRTAVAAVVTVLHTERCRTTGASVTRHARASATNADLAIAAGVGAYRFCAVVARPGSFALAFVGAFARATVLTYL